MKKTVFFDFNGTIIDDLALCLDLLNYMLDLEGKKKVSLERYKEIFTFPIIDYYKLAGFDFKGRSFEELSHIFIDLYQKASLSCPLHDGVIDALKELKQRGYILVCLSASQIDNLKEQLTHFGIIDYFDAVLGIDNIYAKSKVDIGIEYLLKENIDVKNAVMIGDTLHDYEVASKMNIKAILYNKGHQSEKVLSKSGCQIVSSYQEFLEVLNENSI